MIDREKVIKALECCSSYDSFDKTCMKCPYNIHCQEGDTWAIKQDALALLKEQAKTKVVFGRTKDGEFVTECGNCGTHLDKAYSNCPKCKKELDWNSNQT